MEVQQRWQLEEEASVLSMVVHHPEESSGVSGTRMLEGYMTSGLPSRGLEQRGVKGTVPV